MPAYRALTGLNWRPDPKDEAEQRAEAGDIVDDLPPKVAKDFLAQGVIEPVQAAKAKPPAGGSE